MQLFKIRPWCKKRVGDWMRLEVIAGDCFIQSLCLSSISWILNISKDGGSTSSLDVNYPQSEIYFFFPSCIWMELAVFQFVPIASHSVTGRNLSPSSLLPQIRYLHMQSGFPWAFSLGCTAVGWDKKLIESMLALPFEILKEQLLVLRSFSQY